MTATNHALTGSIIGLAVGQPLIALPAAFVSHFVCDALPHYGSARPDKAIRSDCFRNYLIVEASVCFLLILVLALTRPDHWQLASLCAFLAASPDFFWINKYVTVRAGRVWHPNAFSRFAVGIQWFQRPIGAVVEVAWAISSIILILQFLHTA